MDNRYDAHTTTTVPYRRAVHDRGAVLLLATRVLGALGLLVTGGLHLQQYLVLYSAVPTIGTLFLLNFGGASVIGLALLTPLQRATRSLGRLLLVPLALAGIALSAVAFAFLLISERMPLFGFQEPGYSPPAILAAQVAEMATVLFLGTFLVGRVRLHTQTARW
jgi:hypothetical protein